jgi:hypothetical protein
MTTQVQTEDLPLCARCGALIALTGYRAWLGVQGEKNYREILLCPKHHREHEASLSKQHWNIERLTPPDPVAGPKRYVKCSLGCMEAVVAREVWASPESRPVLITHCLNCDTRTCNHVIGTDAEGEHIKCDSKAMHRDDPLCPKGHPLMGSES